MDCVELLRTRPPCQANNLAAANEIEHLQSRAAYFERMFGDAQEQRARIRRELTTARQDALAYKLLLTAASVVLFTVIPLWLVL